MKPVAPILVCVLALAGCDQADMVTQGKSDTWDRSTFLPQHRTMQAPVPGTVARDEPSSSAPQPSTMTTALLERGHERYDIFCAPCHGATGNGDGMIVQRGFPKPDPFTSDRLMQAKAQDFYDVISVGKGTMYGFSARVPPADRWAIAAYIRALQGSQKPVLDHLPAADRAKLEAAK